MVWAVAMGWLEAGADQGGQVDVVGGFGREPDLMFPPEKAFAHEVQTPKQEQAQEEINRQVGHLSRWCRIVNLDDEHHDAAGQGSPEEVSRPGQGVAGGQADDPVADRDEGDEQDRVPHGLLGNEEGEGISQPPAQVCDAFRPGRAVVEQASHQQGVDGQAVDQDHPEGGGGLEPAGAESQAEQGTDHGQQAGDLQVGGPVRDGQALIERQLGDQQEDDAGHIP
jgi:hypothetical protein